jgi:large subunit ribosomal protein L15
MEKKPILKKKSLPVKVKKAVAKPAQVRAKVKAEAKKAEVKQAGMPVSKFGLYNLKVPHGAHKKRKYLGRGAGSGHGKTSTRGSKGQTSRTGRDFYPGFEGGQTSIIRRMPKRGFTSRAAKDGQIINLGVLAKLKDILITPALLEQKGLIKDKFKPVKILGGGDFKNPVTIHANAFSKSAVEKIHLAGGKHEIINELSK